MEHQEDATSFDIPESEGDIDMKGYATMCVTDSDCPKEIPLCVPGPYANNLYEPVKDNQTGHEKPTPLIGKFLSNLSMTSNYNYH